MKKFLSITVLLICVALSAQVTANRFFYQLTFKPKKDSARLDKVMTILDVVPQKSIYQDFTTPAQDSIAKVYMAEMEKTQAFKDPFKIFKMPKFTYKITKTYPDMKLTYQDRISRNLFGYEDSSKQDWKISNEKQKIGEYNTQKATADFGGRKWTAWFSSDIPIQDGPYKFYGLPGLIVKIEDDGGNYSWELKGNKKIDNYDELSESEKIQARFGMSNEPKMITKEKFDQSYDNYKKDPMAEARPYMKPEIMSQKMPGSDTTIGEFMKNQEKMANDYFNSNNNPIEITAAAATPAKKKK